MLSSLISAEQLADSADRVTLMSTRAVLVRGLYNEVLLEGVTTVEQATTKLEKLGYVISRQWLTGQYGSQEAYIRRAA